MNIAEKPAMQDKKNIRFIENSAAAGRKDHYVDITVDVMLVLTSWRESLFSFEWLLPDGSIRALRGLPENEQPKREAVEEKLRKGQPIEKPILGIGVLDNVEIGSGRAEFLTLAAHGLTEIPVHIPKSNEKDFKAFRAGVDS
jgi:hypothetical protein